MDSGDVPEGDVLGEEVVVDVTLYKLRQAETAGWSCLQFREDKSGRGRGREVGFRKIELAPDWNKYEKARG